MGAFGCYIIDHDCNFGRVLQLPLVAGPLFFPHPKRDLLSSSSFTCHQLLEL
jgi:hypothetical protein